MKIVFRRFVFLSLVNKSRSGPCARPSESEGNHKGCPYTVLHGCPVIRGFVLGVPDRDEANFHPLVQRFRDALEHGQRVAFIVGVFELAND